MSDAVFMQADGIYYYCEFVSLTERMAQPDCFFLAATCYFKVGPVGSFIIT